ncbi:MAG: hypothetical protein ACI8Y6_001039, partial [Brevundimonas sp.]
MDETVTRRILGEARSPDQVLAAVQRQGAACDISGTLTDQPG